MKILIKSKLSYGAFDSYKFSDFRIKKTQEMDIFKSGGGVVKTVF